MFTWFEKKVNPYPLETPLQPPKNFWAFLWTCTREIRLFLALMTLTTACCGAFEALLYAMLGGIVDWLGQTPPDRFWAEEGGKLILLAVIILGSPLLIGLMSLLKFQTLSANFPMRLRWIFHRYLLSQSMKFYQDEFAGRIATKVMQTALAVRESIFAVADILVYIVIYFLTMAIIVAHFDPWLLVPYFVWLAAYASTLYYFVPRLGKVAAQQADARALMSGRITDAYANIMTVKLFSHTDRESDYARSAMSEFMVTAYGQMRLLTAYVSINYFLSMAMIVGAAGCSLWLWTDSRVGIGAVAATSALAIRLNGISQWLMWEMAMLFENIGTVQDGINTLSKPIAVVDPPNATELKVHTSEIVFDDVTFSYGNRQPVIENFSLHIRPGEKIGLVGRSGAGKSTLVNLLLRFYNLEQGRILIDGQDIAGVTQNSLRSQIGMVTQDTSLLHRSVRDNLLYGLPNASEETMIEAAINAEAHEFINGLTDPKGRKGYDAHVGERGVKLSGGQRQRIAIARVMLKDAPILLLDEATSALDSEVEAAIQASLYKLMHGKTVVAIAHRLSTIAAMDRLVVIDKGRIVEEGDHASLLASGGIYARLWEHQSGGFLGDDEEETAQQTMEPQPSAL